MALTDAGIKALKPKAARYMVSDGRGLSLDILPSGRMSWIYRYRLCGKYDKMNLGHYPDLPLKKARDKRDELAGQVAKGKSPALEAKLARAGLAHNDTVRDFGERYFKEQVMANWKNPRNIRRYLDKEIYPTYGEKLLKDVNALDVQALVYRKRDNGRVAAAMQLRNVIKQMFDYAIEVQKATINPAAMVATRYIGKARKRSRVLTPNEIRLYLRTVYQSNMRRQFKLALHIILLTLSRKSELLLARWEHVNFEAGEWLIPEGNAKTGKPHIVYLSTQVAEMFRELKVLGGNSELVMPGRSSLARPFSSNALNKALEGLTFDMDPLTIHDLRRNCAFTTEGLGITPGNQFGLIQCSEKPEESAVLGSWFTNLWSTLPSSEQQKTVFLSRLQELADSKAPSLVYYLTLFQIFKDMGDELDEERIVKSATGIRDATVWKKLYKFQRDGVIGAIDKLERLGGCIIADSVGLGKTFEALAIIKYYELRNDRVLVLVPKRLRDNWTLYKANDRRNFLAPDRFHYDVLNHTDLSRDGGTSGDIDLAHVNWGNYDLVVIDESHNFRNKATHNAHETRYDRLMRRIIKAGVKTRVLMLSATPVNNRLADLKNQIAFVTEANDTALNEHGIPSIEATVRQAQLQFNRWMTLEDRERRPAHLLEMLGFDYFRLLDLLTIARSRKHIEKYYGTKETGRFPERLKPINIKSEVDLTGEFRSIREINNEIRRLTLAAYAPLRYVLPHKQAAYDAKYSTKIRGGESFFRQADREESLVHLLRVNVLKRMESSVSSFFLTVQRQLADVDATLAKIEAQAEALEEIDIADVDAEDPAFESLLVGRKVKVLLQDVDRVRWRQDLIEDRNRLYSAASI